MKIAEVSKGITHIEDLPIREFVETLSNLSDYQITEKVDGAQILFGIDEHGFYTSRETKGGARIYNESEYRITFSSTYMRSAHILLEKSLPLLKEAGLKCGDQVEAEVLYGELPNVVPYSADTSYLIFLRTTEGTVSIDRLQKKLNEHVVSVPLFAPYTSDGKNIELREECNTWKFSRVPLRENKVTHKTLNSQIGSIKKFLNSKDPILKQSYLTILETPLNKIPDWVEPGTWKFVKEELKEKKESINSILYEKHISPIKEVLLNHLVRNTGSAYGPPISEGGWIEGVVLKNKNTGKTLKIVDKSVFGTIREQAWKDRNLLTEHAKSIDNAPGFVGQLMLDLATSLGHPELGTIQAKRYITKLSETQEPLAEIIDFESVRDYWIKLLDLKESVLDAKLDKYEKETQVNKKSGFGSAIRKRTLETFSEIFEKIVSFRERALQAVSADDLISVLVDKQLGKLDMRIDEVVTLNDVLKSDSFVQLMSMIKAKPQDLNVTRIKNQVLQSWRKGMRSRKHYDSLLQQIDISLNQLIDK